MSQRIHQALKFFALLVFSFEMLAPAFIPGTTHHKETGTRILDAAATTQNQIYCVIAEELSANEEDGEGHKEFVPLFDFDLISVFNVHVVESVASSIYCIQHTSDVASQRPLYLLNNNFLI